jgi:hypothetical protein
LFLVRLESGTQLLVDLDAKTIILSAKLNPSALAVGKYLLILKDRLKGIDLGTSEGFARQTIVIQNGRLILSDPRASGSEFTVSLE